MVWIQRMSKQCYEPGSSCINMKRSCGLFYKNACIVLESTNELRKLGRSAEIYANGN